MTREEAVALLVKNKVRCVVIDVDGVLTDGSIIVDADGKELFKTFNVKDGLGIQMLAKAGFDLAIITGRESSIVVHRAEVLGIRHLYQGQLEKTAAFENLLSKLGIAESQVVYIGDDRPDVPLLKRVGFSACPADAHPSAVFAAMWKSKFNGGCGAVRELADLLLEAKEKIDAD